MGSAAAALTAQSAALSGEGQWALHQETVRAFWEGIGVYLGSFDPARLKLYQDGLPAGGEMGQRIVEEAARRGSKNYQLIAQLLHRGAELRKTEDPLLLLSEHERIHRSIALGDTPRPPIEQESGDALTPSLSQREREGWDRLMDQRDRYIAETIGTTLGEGELAVLFIGADHHVLQFLPRDISVEMLKDRAKVRDYVHELFANHDDKKLEELRQHLTSPVRTSCKDGSILWG